MTCSMTFAIAKKRSRSPKRKSPKRKSPKRKSPKRRSPKRKSRSPKRKSRSPKRKSRSPKRKSRSPKRKSRSRSGSKSSGKKTGCALQSTAKYTKRGSPPYPANQCCGQVMVGNDGNTWQSRPDKTGVCHWYKR